MTSRRAKTLARLNARYPTLSLRERMGHPVRGWSGRRSRSSAGMTERKATAKTTAPVVLLQRSEGEVVVFGDADVAVGNVVDPAGDGEVAEGDGRGDGGVRLEVLDLEEDVLLGEDVDEGALVVGFDLVLVERG